MNAATAIDPDTLRAYAETHYRVLHDSRLTLRVDRFNGALRDLHLRHGVDCSAFLTACNPFSRALDAAQNEARQAALLDELRRRGLRFLEGEGEHPANGWPAEASVLVLGLDLEAARALGRQKEQNAIVWSAADAIPRLILLR